MPTNSKMLDLQFFSQFYQVPRQLLSSLHILHKVCVMVSELLFKIYFIDEAVEGGSLWVWDQPGNSLHREFQNSQGYLLRNHVSNFFLFCLFVYVYLYVCNTCAGTSGGQNNGRRETQLNVTPLPRRGSCTAHERRNQAERKQAAVCAPSRFLLSLVDDHTNCQAPVLTSNSNELDHETTKLYHSKPLSPRCFLSSQQ